MKFTANNISRIALAPGKTDEIAWDDELTGFGLRVRSGGSRKWIYQYRLAGNVRRHTIGTVGPMQLEEARKRARKLRVDLDDGKDPAAEKASARAASSLILSKVMVDYLAARQPNMKPKSYEATSRNLKSHWRPLHGLAISSITRSAIAAHLRTLASNSGPVAADRARASLSAMFGWAIGEGLCDVNPVVGTNRTSDDKPRERVLSDAELAAVWKALPDNHYGRIVKLLMLTAQRRDEIGGLSWSEIQGEGNKALIALPSARTKNSRQHDVPLSAIAFDVLDSAPVIRGRNLVFGDGEGCFSGWSRSKRRLDEKLGKDFTHWTLHDLRRTAATRMADLGVAPHIIEAVLNHVSGHKGGVAGIYNRSVYTAEKRAALDLWARHVEAEILKSEQRITLVPTIGPSVP